MEIPQRSTPSAVLNVLSLQLQNNSAADWRDE
jgi:hypothetical protein